MAKKPTVIQQMSGAVLQGLTAVSDTVNTGVPAALDAIEHSATVVGETLSPIVESGFRALDDAIQQQTGRRPSQMRGEWDFINRPMPGRTLQIRDPDLPPTIQRAPPIGATPHDIEVDFRRRVGMPQSTEPGRWPEVADVRGVPDMPRDNNVAYPRPSRAYLPYVQRVVGADPEYMSLLLGKESPRDTLTEGPGTSSAVGVGQMIDDTAIDLFRKYAPRLGATSASHMSDADVLGTVREDRRWQVTLTAQYQIENADAYRKQHGRNPTWAEVREMHFFGNTENFRVFHAKAPEELSYRGISQAVLHANKGLFFDATGKPRTVKETQRRLHGGWPNREFTDRSPTRSAE